MKLLPKKGSKEAKKQPVKEEVRLNEQNNILIEAINDKIKDFNLIKSKIESNIQKLEEDYQEKFTDAEKKLTNLFNEIRTLEDKRKKTLEPLIEREAELGFKENALEDRKNALILKEIQIEETKESLETSFKERMSLYESKTNNLNYRETGIINKENQLEFQRGVLKKLEEELGEKWSIFYQKNNELLKKEHLITQADQVIKNQSKIEQSLGEQAVSLAKKELSLEKEKQFLIDRELIVNRGKEENEKSQKFIAEEISKIVKREIQIKKQEKIQKSKFEDLEASEIKLKNDWFKFETTKDTKNKLLKAETERLEIRRLKALEPIDNKRQELTKWVESLEKQSALIAKQGTENKIKSKELLDKEEKLVFRENDIRNSELRLSKFRSTLNNEKQELEKGRDLWQQQRGKEWQTIETEKIQIERLKQQIKAQEEINQKIADNFKFQQLTIDKDRKHLESQQATLKAAFEELRSKNAGK